MATGFYKAQFFVPDRVLIEEVDLVVWVVEYEIEYYFKNGALFDIPSKKEALEQKYGLPVYVKLVAVPKVRIAPVSQVQTQVRRRPWLGSMIHRISTFFNF